MQHFLAPKTEQFGKERFWVCTVAMKSEAYSFELRAKSASAPSTGICRSRNVCLVLPLHRSVQRVLCQR